MSKRLQPLFIFALIIAGVLLHALLIEDSFLIDNAVTLLAMTLLVVFIEAGRTNDMITIMQLLVGQTKQLESLFFQRIILEAIAEKMDIDVNELLKEKINEIKLEVERTIAEKKSKIPS